MEWAYFAIGVGIVLLLVGIGALADWGIRHRVKAEVGGRMRERADNLRAQANQGMGFEGFDPGEPDCQDCPQTEVNGNG